MRSWQPPPSWAGSVGRRGASKCPKPISSKRSRPLRLRQQLRHSQRRKNCGSSNCLEQSGCSRNGQGHIIMRPQQGEPASSRNEAGSQTTRNTGLIYLSIRGLVNALALVLAMMVTPGISIRANNPHVPLAVTTLLIGVAFALLNTIVRPLLLLLTGRLVVRTVGLFLLVNQVILFWILDLLFHPFKLANPAWFWIALAGV